MEKLNSGCLGILKVMIIALISSCSSDNASDEAITAVIPTNLSWSIQVVGSTTSKPNGDGSGMILCTASAKNAVRYGFKFDEESPVENATGELEHTFKKNGVNSYSVSISAYSNTGDVISISKTVEVFVADGEEQAQLPGLIWSDEFDDEGPLNTDLWFSEIVPPVNGGWFNNEQQHYTNRTDNAYISNGTLKIVAKKEVYTAYGSTKNYTSARLNSKFSFTYGRIEVRAKLPEGGGTWPAIWTLGSNLNTIGWPFCGEIDIMEHTGNNIGDVSSAIHTPSSNGNTINIGRTNVPDATSSFHVYAVDWSADKMDFYVDNTLFYTYNPSNKNSNTWPFDADQFILLNIAMGGTLGGNIASDFNQAVMEIDYVRVYQVE